MIVDRCCRAVEQVLERYYRLTDRAEAVTLHLLRTLAMTGAHLRAGNASRTHLDLADEGDRRALVLADVAAWTPNARWNYARRVRSVAIAA